MAETKSQSAASRSDHGWLAKLGIDGKDLALLGSLASLAILAWCVPQRHWHRLSSSVAGMQPWRWRPDRLRGFEYVKACTRVHPGLGADACARAHRANIYLERLLLLACYPSGHWRPEVRLDGCAQIEATLAAGKGAIFWVAPFVFSDLLTKVALHDAGLEVSHLSRYAHGFSATPFGERFLNPIRTSIEQRYLAERLVMTRQGSMTALRELSRRLHANRMLSMTAIGSARQLYRIPFLNGSIQMARGVPRLAIRTGAPVLPVFTGRDPDGAWLTIIEPPLVRRDEWEQEEAVKRLLLQYAALLEYYVQRWPDQFRPGYLHFQTD